MLHVRYANEHNNSHKICAFNVLNHDTVPTVGRGKKGLKNAVLDNPHSVLLQFPP